MLITSLKREIKDKEQICQKSQTQIDSLQTQIQSLNETIQLLKHDKDKLEKKVETTKDEIGKGNQIIQKL